LYLLLTIINLCL